MLTVYSTQGSPGASTTAMHLAANWASDGREVLLIELDPAGGSLSHNLGIQFTPGSASFVASGLPVLSNHLIDHAQDVLFENLHVMPTPASPSGARGIFNTFSGFAEDLRAISENEMAVVIDGGRVTADTAASALTTGATGVVVVCGTNSQMPSLEHLKGVLDADDGYGPVGCAVSVGKSPMDPDEWLETCGLNFCGSIEFVSDMTTDLSAYMARSKRKSKKWRASLEKVGEELYRFAHPPASEASQRRRAAAAAAASYSESGETVGVAAPAPAPPTIQEPADSGQPPAPPPEPPTGYAPPMAPAPAASHEPSHYLPPSPESPPSHGQSHYLPPSPESPPSHGQSHYLPPSPESPPSHGQSHYLPPTAGPEDYGQAPPPMPPEDHPGHGQPVPPPHVPPQYPAGHEQPQYPAAPYEQPHAPPQYPAGYEQPQYPADPYNQPQYPAAPYEQPAPHPQHAAHSERPAAPHEQSHPVGGGQPDPAAPQSSAARPVPPPKPSVQPTGSFRDWALKLHGSNAEDMTARRGG